MLSLFAFPGQFLELVVRRIVRRDESAAAECDAMLDALLSRDRSTFNACDAFELVDTAEAAFAATVQTARMQSDDRPRSFDDAVHLMQKQVAALARIYCAWRDGDAEQREAIRDRLLGPALT